MTNKATKLKDKIGKRLDLSQNENVLDTKNEVNFLNEFAGSIKSKSLNCTKDDIKRMRIKETYNY